MIGKVVENLVNAKQPQSDFVKLMDSFKDPYLVLIACILSLRTNDRTTYPATLRMLELAKTPQEMMIVEEDELAKAIYPVGFYKNKAGQIIELSRKIVEDILNCGRLAPSAKNRQPWYFAYFFKNRLFYKLSHKKAIYSFSIYHFVNNLK